MNDSTTKICSKCGQAFPRTIEYFQPRKDSKDGLAGHCRICRRLKSRIRENDRYNNDPDFKVRKIAAKKRTYARNRQNNEWVKREREKTRARQSSLRKRPDVQQREKDYRNSPKGKYIARVATQRYQARKRQLPDNFTSSDWCNALDYFHGCCCYCGNQADFWNTIEAEHFTPLMNSNCPGTVPTNIVPACRYCNASKADNDPVEWLTSKYGKRKATQILKRIQVYFDSLA